MCTIGVFAQTTHVQYDTGFVNKRSFADSSINTYKQDRDFQYDKYVAPQPSFWDRFWDWVWKKFDEIMSTSGGRFTVNTLLILFGVAAIVFFILKVMKMNRVALFSYNADKTGYTIGEEDIYNISFDAAIDQALKDSNYRLAVRLLYLQNLKLLADKNLIDWQLTKTNAAYINELASNPLQDAFSGLTHVFEYVWYGNSNVSKSEFDPVQAQFLQFKNQL